jgi:hypothetical protein
MVPPRISTERGNMMRGGNPFSPNKLIMHFLVTAVIVAVIFRVNALEKIVTGKTT